ncbi:hypothetical protein [Cupriavidus sp. UYPR2.512]|uniref:hypothetical protein n=1 Tax=Cupriavidus sp. UYPR2.512 TaxID=1080187 RepID=UPI000376D357|nr:hypothetical protein [Cupriavidus sp. UYPR2.512]UIF86288.1 hypothetical protein KAF44_00870 [Cupriavidus necator]
MTDHEDKKTAPLPWRWRIALARILCALVLGLAGFLWTGWLMVTGRGWEAILCMIATWACARLLAGGLYGYKG